MNNTVNKPKNTATAITVVICAFLVLASFVISMLYPSISQSDPFGGIDMHGKVHYADMEYKRPDVEALIKELDTLTGLVNSKASFGEQSEAFMTLNTALGDYYTMYTLIQIKYFGDNSNEFYTEEYNLLDGYSVDVQNKVYKLMDTIEASEFKDRYERTYFGEGYFDDWVSHDYSDEVLELMKRETEITNKYLMEIADPVIQVGHETFRIRQTDFSTLNEELYHSLIEAYNEKFAAMFAEVVKIRLEIAEKLGVDYDDFAYGELQRDYTPEQADAYVSSIIENVVPLYKDLTDKQRPATEYTDTVATFTALKNGSENMGGIVERAFDYMFEYGLYDLSYSETKSAMSFQTYIMNYNAPFMFVSPYEDSSDFSTFSHEFGHYVDSYYNYNDGITIDNTEIASQAMAYIMPYYVNDGLLADYDYLQASVAETMSTYINTAFVSYFESEVYKLKASEVSADKINEIAAKCAADMGLDEAITFSFSNLWIEIQHIFISPMYYVSYVISNDVALQVLEAELETPGRGGLDAYINVIDRNTEKTFEEDLKISGFDSPFAEGRAEALADLIEGIMAGEYDEEAVSGADDQTE